VRLFRIAPERYLEDLSGKGASYTRGGRWNRAGVPVIYMAPSASTAMLEMANYLPSPQLVPKAYRIGVYELPGSVRLDSLSPDSVPRDWNRYPYPASTQEVGTRWHQQGTTLGLRVPSVAVPGQLEDIIVINPLHPDVAHLKLMETVDLAFNPRVFGGQ